MSTLTSLARALAADSQMAQRACAVRHVHIADRPLVVIPLTLAGEANAPLAAMIGDNPDTPALLFVPEPRDRDACPPGELALDDLLQQLCLLAQQRGGTQHVGLGRGVHGAQRGQQPTTHARARVVLVLEFVLARIRVRVPAPPKLFDERVALTIVEESGGGGMIPFVPVTVSRMTAATVSGPSYMSSSSRWGAPLQTGQGSGWPAGQR